ncbi:MAG: hypothetical protein ABN478_04295 [Mixta sp.]
MNSLTNEPIRHRTLQNVGHEVCNRVTTLENQRKAVLVAIK